MKSTQKSVKILIIILAALFCVFGSACDAGNAEILGMNVQPILQSLKVEYSDGVAITYGIKDAEIEMYIYSDNSEIIFDCSKDIKELDKYEYISKPTGKYLGRKKYTHSNGSLCYVNTPVFQIRPIEGWHLFHTSEWWNEYVYFIAHKDGKVVGYAVMYFYTAAAKISTDDGVREYGKGKVLADKEVSGMSEEAVREKIQKVIEKHKK